MNTVQQNSTHLDGDVERLVELDGSSGMHDDLCTLAQHLRVLRLKSEAWGRDIARDSDQFGRDQRRERLGADLAPQPIKDGAVPRIQ